MSKITFLIGNGFDKQLGLETGYDQFLEWYIKQKSENENIREYKEELRSDPRSQWWSDAEIAMGEHIKDFDVKTLGNYYERIRDFKIKLAKYLEQQVDKCDFSDEKTIGDAFTRFLLNFQKDILLQDKIHNQFNRRYGLEFSFICFNYTDTLARLVDITKRTRERGHLYEFKSSGPNIISIGSIDSILDIHGSLKTSLIMGVNDISQLAIPPENISAKLRRTLIKPEINSALGRGEDNAAKELLLNSSTIVVYGLKMGDTDKKWRDLLAVWPKEGEHSVVLFGHKKLENVNTLIPEDVLDYVDEKQTAFLKKLYPGISEEEIELLRDRVFIVDKTNYLNFHIIPEKQLATVK